MLIRLAEHVEKTLLFPLGLQVGALLYAKQAFGPCILWASITGILVLLSLICRLWADWLETKP